MSQQTTVFVCATYADLSEERGAVLDAIQRLQLQYDSMEFFGARPEQPIDTCLGEVRKSNIVVVIVGQKYGSIVPNDSISFSEAEYNEARRLGLPCLVYLRHEDLSATTPGKEEPNWQELERWKILLTRNHTVYKFKNSQDLALQVSTDVSKEIGRVQTERVDKGFRLNQSSGTSEKQAARLPQLRFAQRFGDQYRQLLYCLTLDRHENIILGGSFWGEINFGPNPLTSLQGQNIFVAKLDSNGRHLWSLKSGGAGEHVAAGVATDGTDAVYIASAFNGTIDFGGATLSSKCRYSIALAKLNSEGRHIWSRAFGTEGYYVPEGLAITADGRIVIAGRFAGSIDFGGVILNCQSSQTDIFLFSTTPDGEFRWARRLGGPYEQQTRSIAINAKGETIVAGVFKGSIDFGVQMLNEDHPNEYCGFLAKFDDMGETQWCKRFGEPFAEQGTEVAFDQRTGDIVASGLIRNKLPVVTSGGANSRCLLARYDSSGILQWSKTFDPATITSISIGPSGRLLLSGNFSDKVNLGTGLLVSAGGLDIFAAGLEGDGTPLWSRRFGDERHQFLVKGITSPRGTIILAGSFHGTIDFGGGPLVASGYDGRSEGSEDVFLAMFDSEKPIASEDFDKVEKALRFLSKQLLALEDLVRETREEKNTILGFEQLRRWKEMTVQLLEETVSRAEATALRNKKAESLILGQPMRNFLTEARIYEAFLLSLNDSLQTHPDKLFSRGYTTGGVAQAASTDLFISYSTADAAFVARLAQDLNSRGIKVWWDKWMMKVGDSLHQKIDEGITNSAWLGVVLSPNSIHSPWVEKELNSALMKELEQREVFVLPILYKDCPIPLMLKDKVYADFRSSYDEGLSALLERLA